jgi:hypothetical protein
MRQPHAEQMGRDRQLVILSSPRTGSTLIYEVLAAALSQQPDFAGGLYEFFVGSYFTRRFRDVLVDGHFSHRLNFFSDAPDTYSLVPRMEDGILRCERTSHHPEIVDPRTEVLRRLDLLRQARGYYLIKLQSTEHFELTLDHFRDHHFVCVERRSRFEQLLSYCFMRHTGISNAFQGIVVPPEGSIPSDAELFRHASRAIVRYYQAKPQLERTTTLVYEDWAFGVDPVEAVAAGLGLEATTIGRIRQSPLTVRLVEGGHLRFFRDGQRLVDAYRLLSSEHPVIFPPLAGASV